MAEKFKWIDVNEKLLIGVKKINALSASQFSTILNHIVQTKNPLRELGNLPEQLNLSSPDLNIVLQCLMLVYKESQRVILKPTDLQTQLTDYIKLDSDKSEAFVKVWSDGVRNKFGNFEKQLKLSNFSWELDLETSSTFSSNTAKPTARIQLEVVDTSKNDSKDTITLENLDEEALRYLYNSFEVIQKKLDVINA